LAYFTRKKEAPFLSWRLREGERIHKKKKKEELMKACQKTYNIAIASKIFVGSILDDLCRGRPSGPSLSFFEGAVTGSVGSALDQKGSSILRNL